ncbi:phosphatidate cytidylyltransferase [Peptostreptococcus canis]|uniref:Phosphatidate cytidylyltransferase n=1 Tax=Peptostreptococcus canis TaxID=1159213 RepID=A0ABR6TKA4_9FIRM|nr:phosphatidate cytidylyltransferase [Peptostreptococcus canis]MBC2575841.1 phosphatidate cytidylyltransferase [Peptostreptococcus canis]MBP1998042.1 phosphatidate cytidylyltransferase [Peptostreptococcus canis]
MKQRLISALFLLPLLILLVIKGVPLYVGGAIIISIALHEFYSAFENIEVIPIKEIGYIYTVLLMFSNIFKWKTEMLSLILFIAFFVSIIYVLKQKRNVIDVSITFSGIFYVCFCFNYIIMTIDNINKGHIYVWLIFIIAFATDIFAYFVGKNYGKHKLIPDISPKKTIEGSIGGILGSVAFCVLFGLIFRLPFGSMVLLSFVGSVIAQMGDLIASSIKRYVGIKDYGKIIPGHGGVLDRFDSVILVAPYVYLVLTYLAK